MRSVLRPHRMDSTGLAEDLTHDAFLRLTTHAADYRVEVASVRVYLRTIARNLARDCVRSSYRWKQLLGRDASGPSQLAKDPEHALGEARSAATVREWLGRLDPLSRSTMEAAFYLDLSYPEIASRQSVPLNTVKSRMARGLARLREMAQRDGCEEASGHPARLFAS